MLLSVSLLASAAVVLLSYPTRSSSIMSGPAALPPALNIGPTILLSFLCNELHHLRDSLFLHALASYDSTGDLWRADSAAALHDAIDNAPNRGIIINLVAHAGEEEGALYSLKDAKDPELTRAQLLAWLEKRGFSSSAAVLCCVPEGGLKGPSASTRKVAWQNVDDVEALSVEQFAAKANAFAPGLVQLQTKTAAAAKKDNAPRKSQCDNCCIL
jgi:hypothetical protein